jgi:lipid II:glycine glycyltransferase (peptidoglycan interpeptide bridge formation enzyme)
LFDISYFKQNFELLSYIYEDHLDIHINLSKQYEEFLVDVHKSRKRNLTKAVNKGVKLRELKTEKEIKAAFDMISETYKRIKIPVPKLEFFINIYRTLTPNNYSRFYGAFSNNDMIGSRLILTYKKTIYDFYAGSASIHSNKYPNDFLIMNILKEGFSGDFRLFDFGGAGKPNIPYNVRDYKLQFGGQIVNLGRYVKTHMPILGYFSRIGYYFWKKANNS